MENGLRHVKMLQLYLYTGIMMCSLLTRLNSGLQSLLNLKSGMVKFGQEVQQMIKDNYSAMLKQSNHILKQTGNYRLTSRFCLKVKKRQWRATWMILLFRMLNCFLAILQSYLTQNGSPKDYQLFVMD